jgi:hypothetical protein
MNSKNKPPMTASERRHVSAVKQLDCVVCDAPGPSEAHEPEQGAWFTAIALCPGCHRGPAGWHGDRGRWKNARMTEIQAINETLRRING